MRIQASTLQNVSRKGRCFRPPPCPFPPHPPASSPCAPPVPPGRGKQLDFPRRRRRVGQRARVCRRLDREAVGTTLRARPLGQPRRPQGRGSQPSGQPRGPPGARRGAQAGGSTKPSSAASCSALSLELSAFSSNFSSAFRKGAGGPRSRNSREGGRRISMFRMHVARENMT